MRRRELPQAPEILAALAEFGVTDAPTDAPDPEALRGLLDMAAFVAEHRKKVTFPAFAWADPGFFVQDAKVALRVAYAELAGDVGMTLKANLPRLRDGRTLLAIDARRSGAKEFDVGHALFGQPTLFAWPTKPPESADPRIDAAAERGWVKALKVHNLLPGRGIVVLDEHQGLLLRDGFEDVLGFLLLFENGLTELWWNPFVRADANDPDLQYWLTWGLGVGAASEWRETFFVEKDDE